MNMNTDFYITNRRHYSACEDNASTFFRLLLDKTQFAYTSVKVYIQCY